jgi:hypothetical protein
MSNAAPTSKFSFYNVGIPAGALLLAGLSLFYSMKSDGTTTASPSSLPVSSLVAQPIRPELGLADRSTNEIAPQRNVRRPAFRPNTGETAPDLMRLHQRIADARGRQAENERLMAEIDRQHQAESIDASWSAQAETAVLSTSINPLMSQSGLKPQDFDTDCRSSTCRISAKFTQSTDAESWATMMVTEMAGTMSQARMAIKQLPDGSSEVRIYGVRQGIPHG